MILYNKVKSTFMVDGEIYKRIRILAIERNMEVSALIEESMREKLEREYPHYHQLQQQPQDKVSKTVEESAAKTVADLRQEPTNKSDYAILELPFILTLNLPGIKFPTNKSKIMELTEKANTSFIITHVVALPNKTYKSKSEIKKELLNNARTIGPVLDKLVKEGNFGYEIDDRELGKDQYQKRISQQQNELKKLSNIQDVKKYISAEY